MLAVPVAPRTGFSLLELLVAVALLVVLATMTLPALEGPLTRRRLDASADQLRSLFYFASAEARQLGCRLEIRLTQPLDEGAPAAEVAVERDPHGAPGVFEPLAADWARWQAESASIRIESVEVAESLELEDNTPPPSQAKSWPAIIIGFDGRSQVGDARIVLGDADGNGRAIELPASGGPPTVTDVPLGESQEGDQ